MTAVRRIDAAIDAFPFLEQHIFEFADKELKLEFLPYSAGLFFLRKQSVFFYDDNRGFICSIHNSKSVEQRVDELYHLNGADGYRGVITFVRVNNDGVQVYLPPKGCVSTARYMYTILDQERKIGKVELEKVIEGLVYGNGKKRIAL